MALRYDRPTEGYTTRIPPGVTALRLAISEHFNIKRHEVIRSRERCAGQSSEHCVCRGIDFFTTDLTLGRRIFDFLVRHADTLGIQSVIFNHRQWGFGNWTERGGASSPHTDHVHVGQNLWSAANLTQGMVRLLLGQGDDDDMTPQQDLLLRRVALALGVADKDQSDARGWMADLHRELVSGAEQPPGSPQTGVGKLIRGIASGTTPVKASITVDSALIAQEIVKKLGPTMAADVAKAVIAEIAS